MLIIGRLEIVNLTELSLDNQIAKIDTGAYTSSLHCEKVSLIDNKLHCVFLRGDVAVNASFQKFSQRTVKSSNGQSEDRFSIFTTLKLGNKEYKIELTLTDRAEMKYPILLGRKFLRKRFHVDVSKKNNLSQAI